MKLKRLWLVMILILGISIGIGYEKYSKDKLSNQNIKKMEEETDSYSVLSIMIENESGEYEISNDSTWPGEGYVFNDVLSKCENGSQISYNKDTKKVQLKSNKSDRCYVYFDIKRPLHETCNDNTLACMIAKKYGTDSNLYLHDSTLENGAGDGSYRYAGADSSNYVCFGSTASSCPDDNLYRIIGVFDNNVKLIKYDYATSELLGTNGDYANSITPGDAYKGSQTTIVRYNWNASTSKGGTNNNNWNESRLNTINLNTNYVNNIGSTWSEKIAETNWNIGGHTTYNATVKTFYDAEKTATYKAKIGLMSVSEYGYATIPDNWTINLYNYSGTNVKNNNWMHMGCGEWTITHNYSTSNEVFAVLDYAYVNDSEGWNAESVRPSFSLKSSITYVGGSGSKTDPIRIS